LGFAPLTYATKVGLDGPDVVVEFSKVGNPNYLHHYDSLQEIACNPMSKNLVYPWFQQDFKKETSGSKTHRVLHIARYRKGVLWSVHE
jgi:hypothetical protein